MIGLKSKSGQRSEIKNQCFINNTRKRVFGKNSKTLVEAFLLIASYVARNVSFPFHVQDSIQAYKDTKIEFLSWKRSVTNYTKGANKSETVCIKVKQTLNLSRHAWSTGESAH